MAVKTAFSIERKGKEREENVMEYGLFEINFNENNGYRNDFNESMRYMIERFPELLVRKEKDDILLVQSLSVQATNLIEWLEKSDCLNVTKIIISK